MKFIYIFNSEDKDKLELLGYTLLKHDANNNIWVFVNEDNITSAHFENIDFCLSDILTF